MRGCSINDTSLYPRLGMRCTRSDFCVFVPLRTDLRRRTLRVGFVLPFMDLCQTHNTVQNWRSATCVQLTCTGNTQQCLLHTLACDAQRSPALDHDCRETSRALLITDRFHKTRPHQVRCRCAALFCTTALCGDTV